MKFTFPPESKPLDGYTIKRAIHRGGFGEVYYALSDAGKEVALKLLQQNMDVELRGVSQCMNLKHPNLLTIFDIRSDADGDHWIVMEYVAGKSLNQIIDDSAGPTPMADVRAWMEGITAGLTFLHDRGIVHRDLKPANIYRENGVVKIGDIGLAKFISESRRSAQTQSVGTVYYMAPEVAHGRYGREVDIYSLGIMLYELLTGDVPFDGESTAEILMKHLSEPPNLSAIPKNLRPVLAGALEKDPLKRTANAKQLMDDFNRALDGGEIPQDIPDDSFVGETRADSSVVVREAVEQAVQGAEKAVRAVLSEDVVRKGGQAAHKAARQARHVARNAARQAQQQIKKARHEQARRRRAPENGHRRRRPPSRHSGSKSTGEWVVIAVAVFVGIIVIRSTFGRSFYFGGGSFAELAIAGAVGYGIYRLFSDRKNDDDDSSFSGQSDVAPQHTEASVGQQSPAAVPKPAVKRPTYRTLPRPLTPLTRRAVSVRTRMTDLTGSMTVAVFCTALITAGLAATTMTMWSPAQMGLFATVTLLGSWAVLIMSKLNEGRGMDSNTMRLMMLACGAAVGAAAFGISDQLMINLTPDDGFIDSVFETVGPYALIVDRPETHTTAAGFVVFFAGLFGLRRWWWHADCFRKRRFRVMSVVMTVGLGLLLTMIWSFPQVWGLTWAAAISSVVQLSSTWVPPDERSQLLEGPGNAA